MKVLLIQPNNYYASEKIKKIVDTINEEIKQGKGTVCIPSGWHYEFGEIETVLRTTPTQKSEPTYIDCQKCENFKNPDYSKCKNCGKAR